MPNPFYDPGRARSDKVQQLFSGIARRYDLINDLQSFGLHRCWKNRLVKMARPHALEKALDICCGTGDIAFALAKHEAEIVGLDFSEAMLVIAESKVQRSKSIIHNPRFFRGDAQKIPFPDESFDIVTVGYGLRNLADWELGLKEMCRVAKPGARILSLEFGKPENAMWRKIYFAYLRCFVPLLGKIFSNNSAAYAYILESLKHFPAQNGIAAKMKELKLENVRVVNFFGGVMSINYGEKPRA